MKYSLKEILDLGEKGRFAVPAFNIYSMEILTGVVRAAEQTGAPVIFQMYNRLFNTETGRRLAPSILAAINELKTPAAFHLDHGAGEREVVRAIAAGVSGVMIDASTEPYEKNVAVTKRTVELAGYCGVSVEAELGHVGSAREEKQGSLTDAGEAARFTEETGVDALAVMVGTAHGRYKRAPVLAIERIAEIHAATGAHLVLHGGSGVDDGQLKAAVDAGIRKVNYATDLCLAFMHAFDSLDKESAPLDVLLSSAAGAVSDFAAGRIKVLGADRYAKKDR